MRTPIELLQTLRALQSRRKSLLNHIKEASSCDLADTGGTPTAPPRDRCRVEQIERELSQVMDLIFAGAREALLSSEPPSYAGVVCKANYLIEFLDEAGDIVDDLAMSVAGDVLVLLTSQRPLGDGDAAARGSPPLAC